MSRQVVDAISVAIPTLFIGFVSSWLRSGSQMAAWSSSQRSAIANLVHAASRQNFAATQDRNKYMRLMHSASALAQLEAARRVMTDEDLSRLTGANVRAMAHELERHQRKIVAGL
jgi:hypothetical protein